MKRIAVIAVEREFADFIKSKLKIYFGDVIEINAYSIKELAPLSKISEEIVVLSAYTIFLKIKDKLKETSVIQTVRQSLSTDNIDVLNREYPKRPFEKAYLVNIDYRMCMDTIMQLYEAGWRSIELLPFYGDDKYLREDIKVAITPGESQIAPKHIDRIIDIGERGISIDGIIELSKKVGKKNPFATERAKAERKKIIKKESSLETLLHNSNDVEESVKSLVEYIGDGIILTDSLGRIYMSNEYAQGIFGHNTISKEFNICDILPGLKLNPNLMQEEQIFKINNKNIVMAVNPVKTKGDIHGYIFSIRNFEEFEDKQHKIRNRVYGTSHKAYFTFDDIICNGNCIKEKKNVARRMAKSGASILITGPSGTGKEVFAQSIHNASERKNYNFVAINCAAIPESLFESELFGYEAGAFSGANKNGKIGYFELAHKGTLFLDEIGEMPLTLQGKLLRAIEERKISRIGSYKLINVDVRIIGATNQEIDKLVSRKMFREDLFFRLNVLPLYIPALKERPEDVLGLIYHFREKEAVNKKWVLDSMVEKFLLQYNWPGNIREVRNIVQYFDSLNQDVISMRDLPKMVGEKDIYFNSFSQNRKDDNIVSMDRSVLKFVLMEGRELKKYIDILEALLDAKNHGLTSGRVYLSRVMEINEEQWTEAEIRNGLKKLSEMGFVKSARGRGGSRILAKGEYLLKELKKI